MIFKDSKVYEVLKWIALVALNSIGLLYKTLADVWGFPFGEQIQDTCAALAICLGTLIGVSSIAYRKFLAENENDEAE